jgi:hypothetical protein
MMESFAQLPDGFVAQLSDEFNGPLTPAFTKATHFSDTIVLSCPADARIGWVAFVPRVQRLCTELLRKECLTRGAIVRGPLYHSDHGDIFGPALIDAYRLESKVAYYPRILIADSALPCVETEVLWRFCRTARTGSDGLKYLDILGSEAGPSREPRLRGGYRKRSSSQPARTSTARTTRGSRQSWAGWWTTSPTSLMSSATARRRLTSARFSTSERSIHSATYRDELIVACRRRRGLITSAAVADATPTRRSSRSVSRRRNGPRRRGRDDRSRGGCRTKEWPCRKATNARRPSQDRGRVRLPRGNRPLCWTDLIPAKIELLSISYNFAPAAGFARQPREKRS